MEVAANNEMDIELESCVGPAVAETRESLPDERAFQVRRRSSSKGSKGSKGSKVKPEDRRNSSFEQECESLEEAAWAKFDDSLPDFFQVLEFAKDGGFSEVHELWDSSRYLRAVLALMMLMANVGTIVINDGGYLVHATHLADEQQEDTLGIHPVDDHVRAIQNDYMISGFLVDGCFLAFASLIGCDHGIHSPRIALICAIELLLLALLLVKAVACFVASFVEKLERVRWSKAYIFWWEVLPELTSFSAMRLLHFATPSVVLSDLYSFAAYAGSRAELDVFGPWHRRLPLQSPCGLQRYPSRRVGPMEPSKRDHVYCASFGHRAAFHVCAGPHFPVHLWRRRQHHAACREGPAKHLAGHGGPQSVSAFRLAQGCCHSHDL